MGNGASFGSGGMMAVLRLVENGGGRVSHNNRGWESRFYGQQLIIAPLGESKRGPTDSPQYSTLHRAPTSVSRIHDKRAAASPFPVRCTHRLACAASIPIARKPPAVALAVGQHPFEERTLRNLGPTARSSPTRANLGGRLAVCRCQSAD